MQPCQLGPGRIACATFNLKVPHLLLYKNTMFVFLGERSMTIMVEKRLPGAGGAQEPDVLCRIQGVKTATYLCRVLRWHL